MNLRGFKDLGGLPLFNACHREKKGDLIINNLGGI